MKRKGCKMVQERLSVSIVVPVYNVSLYIERCVKSVMAQTYPVKECVIVDDASPDDSIAKCEKLIAGYDGPIRFDIFHHNYNRGLSAARNTGTDAAQGDYVFFLDGDDELTLDCIEKLARPIERDASIEMVAGNYQVLSGNPNTGKIIQEDDLTSSEAIRELFYERRTLSVAAWNKLILKKFLIDSGLRFVEGILYEDNPWTFYAMKNLQHLYVIPDITYRYYVRPLSICTGSSYEDRAYSVSIICQDIAEHFTPGEESREAKYYLESYFSFFFDNCKQEGFKSALPLFEKALAGDKKIKDRFRLLVLRLSSKSVLLHWTLDILFKIRLFLLFPFRRLAALLK